MAQSPTHEDLVEQHLLGLAKQRNGPRPRRYLPSAESGGAVAELTVVQESELADVTIPAAADADLIPPETLKVLDKLSPPGEEGRTGPRTSRGRTAMVLPGKSPSTRTTNSP